MKWKIDRNHFVLSRWVDAFQMIINFWIFIKFLSSQMHSFSEFTTISKVYLWLIFTYYINSKSYIEVIHVSIEEYKNNFYIILVISMTYFNIFNIFKWCWFYKTHFLVLLKNTNNTFFSLFFKNTNFC